jgi:hypothetical protein
VGNSTCVASFLLHVFLWAASVEKKGSKHLNVEYLHEEVSLSVRVRMLRLTSRLEESYLV